MPLTIKAKKHLITHHPFFSHLTPDEIEEFIDISFEKRLGPSQLIVTKGEIIDAIYIIGKGEVEVATTKDVPEVVLREGDTIGLNDFGFFSQTGLRTATITTISEVLLLGWEIEPFYLFLQKHPEFNHSAQDAAEKMLRNLFIKRVEPFADLPESEVLWLSDQIEERNIPAGTVVFTAGEQGQECYLIRSGKVEISTSQKKLALLTAPMLFGEMALLANLPRNATAIMLEDGQLLVLRKEHLDKLMQHHDIHNSMMTLVVERCRPEQKKGILHYERKMEDDEIVFILKDPARKKYHQLSRESWNLWQLLDGTKTLQDLTVEMFRKYKIFAPESIAETIFNLSDAGFVILPDTHMEEVAIDEKERTFICEFKRFFWKWTHKHIKIHDINTEMTKCYNQFVHHLFHPISLVIMSMISILGLTSFIYLFPQVPSFVNDFHNYLFLLIPIFLSYLITVLFHEAAHAYTTIHHGRDVHHAGIVLSPFGIVAYIDTSDMWLSDRKSRITVNLAGIFIDLFVAGIISIFALLTQPKVAVALWTLSLIIYYSIFKNLNPIYESDGYYLLKDAYDNPSLRADAYKNWKDNLVYWGLTFAFLIIGIAIAYVFQAYLRLMLPNEVLGIDTANLSWILPLLVILNFIYVVKRKAA